jgi:hypothetical protein
MRGKGEAPLAFTDVAISIRIMPRIASIDRIITTINAL